MVFVQHECHESLNRPRSTMQSVIAKSPGTLQRITNFSAGLVGGTLPGGPNEKELTILGDFRRTFGTQTFHFPSRSAVQIVRAQCQDRASVVHSDLSWNRSKSS